MKRSEFIQSCKMSWHTPERQIEIAEEAAQLAEQAGVTWDPEEEELPAILWSRGTYRFLASGQWQFWSTGVGPEWSNFEPGGSSRVVFEDLGARLMNEREELEKMRNLGREREVSSGLPPNAREVSAPDQPTDTYREGTFWVKDPETGVKELPASAFRELELRRDGWVDAGSR